MVDVSSTSDSQVITISVEGENAKDIVKIANDVVQTFRNEIPKIMKVDNVYILSKATFSDNMSPVKPSKSLLIMVSVVLGTVVGIIIMFFRHLFDNSIKTAEDVELLLNLPVLTIISEIKEESLITQNQRSNNRRKRG
ncbi:YveK family protein [Listeria fleischmannii]|uniref:Acyl-CoA thioester hydrolase n=1 Tax=Listeria fleischmannii FSL S10-1203 TaxID=1265822 RepID=W7DE18_9LIST|nr:GNVR domain-containing protein [Listeria fleischmannii]EUJ47543.1 acyl-CoA thioester hydrolase [Listeria fleischmannii FSL S10-1203]